MSSSASLLPFSVSSSSSSSFSSSTHASLLPSPTPFCFSQRRSISTSATFKQRRFSFPSVKGRRKFPTLPFSSTKRLIVRAAEYKFPDPIPEFADAETGKFKSHLLQKLTDKDIYGESVEEVVGICTEIFSTFLHSEYGGPGTLLVLPFVDMADTLNEQGFPGGPIAARAAITWAQNNVDRDWREWNKADKK